MTKLAQSYTYALMEVSGPAYDEIAAKMREAGYGDAFHVEGSRYAIDMHGIALIRSDRRRNPERRRHDLPTGIPTPARRLWPDRRKS
jgi:hypothetical protein